MIFSLQYKELHNSYLKRGEQNSGYQWRNADFTWQVEIVLLSEKVKESLRNKRKIGAGREVPGMSSIHLTLLHVTKP